MERTVIAKPGADCVEVDGNRRRQGNTFFAQPNGDTRPPIVGAALIAQDKFTLHRWPPKFRQINTAVVAGVARAPHHHGTHKRTSEWGNDVAAAPYWVRRQQLAAVSSKSHVESLMFRR